MSVRVLHILNSAQAEHSALAELVAILARRLSRDYELHVCFFGSDGPWTTTFRQMSVPTHLVPWRAERKDLGGAWAFWSFLRKNRFDLIHQHYGGRSIRWAARAAGVPKIILHLHSRVFEQHNNPKPVSLRGAGADIVIATSRAVAERVDRPDVRVIYPGCELPEHALHPADSQPTIGAACRFVRLKGLDHLLEAVAALRKQWPGLRLELAGSGPEEAHLRARAAELGLGENVRFFGWVDPVYGAMSGWDLFAAPSLEDGFAISVAQAMAAGLPVVASQVGGLPEVVENAVTGLLVPPGDSAGLAAALHRLLSDSVLRTRMGEAARARVRQYFSAERFAREIKDLYASLLDQPVSPFGLPEVPG